MTSDFFGTNIYQAIKAVRNRLIFTKKLMPSRILLLPFFLLFCALGYYSWENDGDNNLWLLFPLVSIAIIYVLSPQIDWFYYKKFTPELDNIQKQILLTGCPFYVNLNAGKKIIFEKRCFLMLLAIDFQSQSEESLPEDFKLMAILPAVMLTFEEENFLFRGYEKMIIYPNAFPSPRYPDHFHHSETFAEDGVLLFSAQSIFQGYIDPINHYPVTAHEWSKIYIAQNNALDWPQGDSSWWKVLEEISGWDKACIFQCIGRPDIELLPVVLVHLLYFPISAMEKFPDIYQLLHSGRDYSMASK
jgi:hypothetical protein